MIDLSPSLFTNPDGTIMTDPKDRAEALLRQQAYHDKLHHLGGLIKALGSVGISCCHSSSNLNVTQTTDDEENPIEPTLEVEEAEDTAVQIGKIGEIITSLGGALAIGPIINLLVMLAFPHASSYSWFTPNSDIKVSPGILLISLFLVLPAVYGAPHCHAQLEIASRTRNNFLAKAKHAQTLLNYGLKNNLDINRFVMPEITVGNNTRAIDQFKLISPAEVGPLAFKQKFQIFGDGEQHLNEFIGLTIIAILRNIQNPIAQYILIIFCVLIAAYACKPEVTTCFNTLKLMNELERGNIINDPNAENKGNCQTTFSAIAKIPAVLYANLLSFQQICFGNFPAGLTFALLATKGNIITQYFINAHTQTAGASQQKSLVNSVANTTETTFDDKKAWQKLTLFGKELVITRAVGTGNERSEPITITIIALAVLAGKPFPTWGQSLLAAVLCALMTATAYSEARNAADHTARVRFFQNSLSITTGIKQKLLDFPY